MPPENPDASDTKPGERRFGCLFWSCLLLLIFGLGLSAWFRAWRASAAKLLKTEMDRIRERGEPVWFSDLAPPEINPNEDAAPLFLASIRNLHPLPPSFTELVAPQPPAPRTLPGQYDEFETVLSQNRSALELLGRAVRRPHFRLPIDYRSKQPFTITLEPVQKSREITFVLLADVLQSIGSGNNDRAVQAVLDCFGLSEMLRNEPFLITQLVRIAIADQAISSLQTLVAYVALSPEQFAAIDEMLALSESRLRLAHSVRCERALLLSGMESLDNDQAVFGIPGASAAHMFAFSRLSPFRMREQAHVLRLMSEFAAAVDLTGPEGAEAMKALNESHQATVVSGLLLNIQLPAREAAIRHRQRIMNARIGMRVQRLQLESGRYPHSLDEAIDGRLAEIPPDLFTGAPLTYSMQGGGCGM
jgi:hypothetical protein